jgi:hypothetical protein
MQIIKYISTPILSQRVVIEMIPALLASGIILYGFIQLSAAVIAVILGVKWKKFEFLPGLFFILLYAVIEVIDLFFFTVINSMFIDVAQFGFILIAIIFFIIGMHPLWSQKLSTGKVKSKDENISSNESVFSLVKKI